MKRHAGFFGAEDRQSDTTLGSIFDCRGLRQSSISHPEILGAAIKLPYRSPHRLRPTRSRPEKFRSSVGLNPTSVGASAGASSAFGALRAGLRASGYIGGETIRIEERYAQGKPEALLGLAQELVQQKVDIIVAVALPSIMAAKAATRNLPIVALDLETDPVASGLVPTAWPF